MLREQYPVKLEAFDVLQLHGMDVENKPYYERKDILYKLLRDIEDTVEYVSYESDLVKAWNEAVKQNREGLIAKQRESRYEHDRSYSWLKVKNWRFETLSIAGFTAGENSRSSFFGSLVLAKDGKFRGCAGSGFNAWELRKLKDIFTDSTTTDKPFSYEQVGEPYTAVKIEMQALVKYYQITENNVMRFPIFISS